MVVASDEYCFVADYEISKVAQIKLDYRVTQEVSLSR